MPVSTKMTKDQKLSLNPVKISRLHSRLMCCLKYENDEYEAARKELPDYGKETITPDDKGKVIGLNLLSRTVEVHLHGREIAADCDYEEIKEVTAKVVTEKGDQNG